VDIVFASTRIGDELFQLCLQFLDRFLLFSMHGESDLSCDYNKIMRGVVGRHRPNALKEDIAAAAGVGCPK
jgi:hypothetical protein